MSAGLTSGAARWRSVSAASDWPESDNRQIFSAISVVRDGRFTLHQHGLIERSLRFAQSPVVMRLATPQPAKRPLPKGRRSILGGALTNAQFDDAKAGNPHRDCDDGLRS
jgi:hypothetical protein